MSLELADPNFKRSYIQAWNLMLEKDLGHNWVAEAGYVGNRQINLQNRWNSNYGYIGGGNATRVLNVKFGRTADTNFHSNVGGFKSWYDSLQSSLQRRFSSGYMVRFTYTWSKALGPRGNENGVDGYTNNTPEYFPLIAKVVRSFDHTHTFNAMSSVELPFGRGKKYATEGFGAMLLGGWQVNGLLTMYTGAPFSVTSAAGSLNAPGNSQTADQIKPEVEIYRNSGSLVRYHSLRAGDRGAFRYGRMGSVARPRAGECRPEHLPRIPRHGACQRCSSGRSRST